MGLGTGSRLHRKFPLDLWMGFLAVRDHHPINPQEGGP